MTSLYLIHALSHVSAEALIAIIILSAFALAGFAIWAVYAVARGGRS